MSDFKKKLKSKKLQFAIPAIQEEYKIARQTHILGEGRFSKVSLIDTGGNKYARKQYTRLGENALEKEYYFRQEASSYKKAGSHKNIVKFWNFYQEMEYFSIILEYVKEGSLKDIFTHKEGRKYNENDVKHIVRQVSEGLSYLFDEKKIIHRDIKPANILVHRYSKDGLSIWVKVADIDCAKDVEVVNEHITHCRTIVGTYGYFAPEVLCKKVRHNKKYNYKCDVWSLGVVAYELLSGGIKPIALPKEAERGFREKYKKLSPKQLLKGLSQLEFKRADTYGIDMLPYLQWCKVSNNAQQMVKKMLTVRPATERPSYKKILESDWIKNKLEKKYRVPLLLEECLTVYEV